MNADHNGLIYRCLLCKARVARITEQEQGQCDHKGHRMTETAADYIDQLERENADMKRLIEQKDEALKQGLIYAEAHANRAGDKHARKDVVLIKSALEAAEGKIK